MSHYNRSDAYQSRAAESDRGVTKLSTHAASHGSYQRAPRQGYGASSNRPAIDNLNQLWMGDLDPSWTETSILDLWTASGENPVAAKIIRDRNAPTRGAYCFVTFTDREAVAAAIEKNGMPIPGSTRSFKLNWASGSNKGPGYGANNQSRGPGDSHQSRSLDFSIFVGDIAPDVTEDMLYAKFKEQFSRELTLVKIMLDATTGLPKGFGFVRFATKEAQAKSLQIMNGVHIGSRSIRVGMAASSLNQNSNLNSNPNLNPHHATPQATITPSATTESMENTVPANKIILALPQPKLTAATDPLNTSLSISNLPIHFSSHELTQMFVGFGDIVSYSIRENQGHVKFLWRSSAEKALLFLTGTTLRGHKLKITWGSVTSNSEKYTGADAPDFNVYGTTDYPCTMSKEITNTYENSELYLVNVQDERLVKMRMHREKVLGSA